MKNKIRQIKEKFQSLENLYSDHGNLYGADLVFFYHVLYIGDRFYRAQCCK